MTVRALSQLLSDLRQTIDGEETSVATLLEGFHERGFGVMTLLFSIPMALPIPKPPGLSTLFGVPLMILTLQQAAGRHTVWMPEIIRRKRVSSAKLIRVLDGGIPWARKIEYLLRPRMEYMTRGAVSHLIGFCGCLMAMCMMIPLPGTNTVPSFGIALMSAGVIMRDGLCVLAGMVAGTLWSVGIVSLYLFFGMEGINALRALF